MCEYTLEIQKALQAGMTFEQLKDNYGISSVPHPRYPNLVLFSYSMIDSPMKERIVQECRGIILDRAENWAVKCRTFKKFFNYGQEEADEIDWNSAIAYEKEDGSLCQLWYYDGKWQVSTSGSPAASGQVGDYPYTFEELFWEVWNKSQYRLDYLHKHCCYAFELCTIYNKVVVIHYTNKLVLTGARNLNSGKEIHAYDIDGFLHPMVFPMRSMEEWKESFESMDPLKQEGYVICDDNFNRIKLKHPRYVALHHLKGSFSMKNLLTVVKAGELDEFNIAFPEYKRESELLDNLFLSLTKETDVAYQRIKHIENQKDFALEATKHPFSGVLFQMRREGKEESRPFYSQMREQYLLKLMGVK
jgi:hypothetical protein